MFVKPGQLFGGGGQSQLSIDEDLLLSREATVLQLDLQGTISHERAPTSAAVAENPQPKIGKAPQLFCGNSFHGLNPRESTAILGEPRPLCSETWVKHVCRSHVRAPSTQQLPRRRSTRVATWKISCGDRYARLRRAVTVYLVSAAC